MALSIVSGRGCVFSVWGRPKKEDMDLMGRELREAAKASGGPVVYITRVPADAPTPDAETRKRLDALLPKALEYCSSYHVVLEGAGFMAAVKRTVLSSLFQIGWRRGLFFVHAFPSEVLHVIPANQSANVTAVLDRARVVGLLAGDAPDSVPPPAPEAHKDGVNERRVTPPI